MYKNEDRKCECYKCELEDTCNYKDKYQRLPRDLAKGALGLCPKLPENSARLGQTLEKQRFDHLMEVCNGLELTDSEIKTLKWISGCDVDTACNISSIIVKAKVNRWKQ